VLGWSDATFVYGSVPKSEPWVAPAQQETSFGARGENLAKQVKKVGITYFSFVFTIFFSL
jgi:hypothetical protein